MSDPLGSIRNAGEPAFGNAGAPLAKGNKVSLAEMTGNKTRLSLSKIDALTGCTLQELITESLKDNLPLIFALVEDTSHKVFFYHSLSFINLLTEVPLNPLNREPIFDAKFYFVSRDLDPTTIQDDSIATLCKLSEYLEHPIFKHIIDLSGPKAYQDKSLNVHLTEYLIAMDLFANKSQIGFYFDEAIEFATLKAKEGNNFCKIFLSAYEKNEDVSISLFAEAAANMGQKEAKKCLEYSQDCIKQATIEQKKAEDTDYCFSLGLSQFLKA